MAVIAVAKKEFLSVLLNSLDYQKWYENSSCPIPSLKDLFGKIPLSDQNLWALVASSDSKSNR